MPLRWISYITTAKFAFEGSSWALYGFDRGPLTCPEVASSGLGVGAPDASHCPTPAEVIDTLEVHGSYWTSILVLALHVLVLRVLGYIVLRYRLREPK